MKRHVRGNVEHEIADTCLAVRLRLLNRKVTAIYEDAIRPIGLRVSQMNILVVLAGEGPMRGVDLARILSLDASTLSRDLERMIARGWVSVAAGKGRARMLEASELGRNLLERALAPWREAQLKARTLLTPDLADMVTSRVNMMWHRP